MNAGIALACAVVCVFNILDLKEHNKKINQCWPDESDQHHRDMCRKFSIGLGGEYLLLVLLLCFFVKQLLEEIL